MKSLLFSAGLAALVYASPLAAQSDSLKTSATAGIYSGPQAEQGLATFKEICAVCHSTSQFTGAAFDKKWVSRRAFDLFEQLRTTMPQDNPGALTREQYLAVVSYLLKLNNYPVGSQPLPDNDEQLKAIVIPPRGVK